VKDELVAPPTTYSAGLELSPLSPPNTHVAPVTDTPFGSRLHCVFGSRGNIWNASGE